MNKSIVIVLSVSVVLSIFLWGVLTSEDKSQFQPATLSYAHHQMELACDSCHDNAFSGNAVMEEKCLSCHKAELDKMDDAHGPKKFSDPRNAADLDVLNVNQCLLCHKEHAPKHTIKSTVTQPIDFCTACHEDISQERPSHASLPADSCLNSGCHNYHDASTLYEDFFAAHQFEPDLLKKPVHLKRTVKRKKPLTPDIKNSPINHAHATTRALEEWKQSEHSFGHANCSDCHINSKDWTVDDKVCAGCHEAATSAFQLGHHGMRALINSNLIRPKEARLKMNVTAEDEPVGCISCHQPHLYSTRFAEAESCLKCHDDDHSKNWQTSKHASIWLENPEKGVSCANCHLPRFMTTDGITHVEHNQNQNLRPNDKMLKTVCMNCHGLEYALSALSDDALIKNNFNRPPSGTHDSMRWVRARNEPAQ